MSVEIGPPEFLGLKQALKELNTMDKKLRREITKDFKEIMAPVVNEAQSRLPADAPLSGMARSWKPKGAELLNWNPSLVKRNLKAFTSGKAIRDTGLSFKQNVGVFGVRWNGPQATLFELAKKGALGQELTARFGDASRIVWKSYDMHRYEVDDKVKELVNRVMRLTGNNGRM